MKRRLALSVMFGFVALVCAAEPAQAQPSLGKAKELYAAANYDEALTMFNTLGSGLSGDSAHTEDAATIAMYRVLCLVAVGRNAEVDAAIDRLVSQHPLYRPPSDELSPKIRTAVSTARVRVLPALVQRRYEESKTAYDRGEFASASVGFKWVLSALSDPDISPLANQPPLLDIKTLAAGFVDLSAKALAPPPPPKVSLTPATVAPPRDFKRVFTSEDSDAVAPVTVRQNMPRFPGTLTTPAAGVIELIIDATGAVETVRMLESVHPQYDSLVLSAAKRWQYQPAHVAGTNVRYLKRIQISLAPDPSSSRRP
ncbi:MAG TPA: energy transducer TonB [Vicinamibacterales bacterium]|nr:energy transducer TonB [Vicinamibacterales bacterium]